MRKIILIGLLAGAMNAATTVTGTLKDAAGGLLSGSCSIQAVGPFAAAAGWRVIGVPYTSTFTAGAFSVSLTPTDSATPSGQYYRVTCTARNAAGNTKSWGPEIWLVPTSGTAVDISSVIVTSTPSPGVSVLLSQLPQTGATVGQCIVWSGTAWAPGSCGSSGSISWSSLSNSAWTSLTNGQWTAMGN